MGNLTENFLTKDINQIMPSLGLGDQPIPLWWTSDFINASPPGTPPDQEQWIVGEFNCSCVGISKNLAAWANPDAPNAGYDSIPAEDKKAAMEYGNLMGRIALDLLSGK